jgi:hypothetical protein
MCERENQDAIRFLDVNHRIGETCAKVPPCFSPEEPVNARVRADLLHQTIHLQRETARQRPTLALVVLGRRQQIDLCLGMQPKGLHEA